MKAFHRAYRVVQKLNAAFLALSCVMIVLITALTLWEVVTRYGLRQPAAWVHPVTSYMLLYCVMLATAYTLQKGGHVRVEVLVELLPPGPRRWMERLAHLLGLAFILVFFSQSWRKMMRVFLEGDRDISMLSVPLWIPAVGMTFGLAMMVITYLFVIVESFREQPIVQEAEPRSRLDID